MALGIVDCADDKSVVQRLVGLPLLSSAYGELVAVYLNGKEARPILRSLCNVAEQSISGVTAIAATGSRPFTKLLQPQIKFVDKLACRGLDVLEHKVPILHQTSTKVVTGTKEHLSDTFHSAQMQVNSMLDHTKSRVEGGVERSKQAVVGGTDVLLGTRLGRVVLSGADMLLSRTEQYVERFLPASANEPEGEMAVEKSAPSSVTIAYYKRLAAVSSKAGRRVYRKSAAGIEHVVKTSRARVASVRRSLDATSDYLVQKTPLNRVLSVERRPEPEPEPEPEQQPRLEQESPTNVSVEMPVGSPDEPSE
uniref:perilipin-2-like isoform X2 n=1 Tax=Myxine glutinosa TaxID=7769 RepID=UPI00358EA8A2